jgi:carboxylesterase type B
MKNSEDCLYLNVWRPSVKRIPSNSKLPVFHFIHGGGFVYGSASEPIFNGSAWPALKDVILVTQNYRMSVFGFFHGNNSQEPGNLALWDQTAGLTWIQENIEFFGGDASRVTLFGQSAGSASVGMHITSPVSSSMFNRAIMMSGSSYATLPPIANIDRSRKMAQYLGCKYVEGDTSWINCMKNVSSEDILNAMTSNSYFQFGPNAGDAIYPIASLPALKQGSYKSSIEYMNGLMEEEGSYVLFIYCDSIPGFERSKPSVVTKEAAKECIRRCIWHPSVREIAANYYTANISDSDSRGLRLAASKAIGDFMFTCATHFYGQEFAKNNVNSKNVYSYHITYRSRFSYFCWGSDWTGVCHGDELFLLFGDPVRRPWMYNLTDVTFSEQLINDWTTFGSTGKLPNQGFSTWPAYQTPPGSENVLGFSSPQAASLTRDGTLRNNLYQRQQQQQGNGRKVYPNYMELNAYKIGNLVYDPYRDCSNLWKNHLYIWSSSQVESMMKYRRLPPPESRVRAQFFK